MSLLSYIKQQTDFLIRKKSKMDKVKRADHSAINDLLTDELANRGLVSILEADLAAHPVDDGLKVIVSDVGIFELQDHEVAGAIQSTVDPLQWWVKVLAGGLTLGTTSTTAFFGDKGNDAYTHSQITNGNPHGTTASDVGADPAGTAAEAINTHKVEEFPHPQYAIKAVAVKSGSDMQFDVDAYYGSPSSPTTGPVGFDIAEAVIGTVVTRWINAALLQVTAEYKCIGGTFVANTLTRMTCELVQLSPSRVIEYTLSQHI